MLNRLTSLSLDWTPKIALLAWTWLAPASTALIGIVILIIIDTLLGIKASLTRGLKFSSRRLSQIVSKIITYSLGIIATHTLQVLFVEDLGFDIFKFTVFIFASIELLSIYENISIILGMDIIKILKNLFKRSGVVKGAIRDTIMDLRGEVETEPEKKPKTTKKTKK